MSKDEQSLQVLISKLAGNPKIGFYISKNKLDIVMDLPDFLDVLAKEIVHPTAVITRGQLAKELKLTAEKVRLQMQRETRKVVF